MDKQINNYTKRLPWSDPDYGRGLVPVTSDLVSVSCGYMINGQIILRAGEKECLKAAP